MHTWRHRETGVSIMHDAKHVGNAIVRVPLNLVSETRSYDNSHEYHLPSSALASFGWEEGIEEAMSLIREMQKPHADQNLRYNEALRDVVAELDRLRRIGR